MGIPSTQLGRGKPFNTEHKLNEYKHIKPVKQTKRGLAPERNEIACKEVDELTSRIVKWKILVDFLAKTHSVEDKDTEIKKPKLKQSIDAETLELYNNEPKAADGSGAGLMLVSPEGKEYTYSLRFEFETTNNEVEYEALLTCLQIAKEMEIKDLAIFIDSQLVANQFNGLFKARLLKT
ncbi:reverse transcriptase domain-containing protein [Tanacetum coccineum]